MVVEERWWPEQEGDVPARPLFSAAQWYLASGWHLMPIAPGTKVPTKESWQVVAANMTYDGVWALWDRDDAPNIGLATGITFDVLDLDGQGGLDSLTSHLAGRYFAPTGPMTVTGSGGRHILFAATGHSNRTNMLPNVDYRGVGGYIVAPPSIHENGNAYRWAKGYPSDLTLPPAPQWLLDLLDRTKPQEDAEPGGDGLDHGSVSSALDTAGIHYRHEGRLVVFQCLTGRHTDTDWSCKTGLSSDPDRRWKCFGCDSWGDADNIANDSHVFDRLVYENRTLRLLSH